MAVHRHAASVVALTASALAAACGTDGGASAPSRDATGARLVAAPRKAALPSTTIAPRGNAIPGARVTLGAGDLRLTDRLAFTATGLLSAGLDGVIRHWSLATGETLQVIAMPHHVDDIPDIALDVNDLVVHAARHVGDHADGHTVLRTQQLGSTAFVDHVLPQAVSQRVEALDDGTLRIWAQADYPAAVLTYRLDPTTDAVFDSVIDPNVEFLPGGVEVGTGRRYVELLPSGRVLAGADCVGGTWFAGHSANGQWLLTRDYVEVRLWSTAGDHRGGLSLPPELRRRSWPGAISPDGSLVLLPGYGGLLAWTPSTGAVLRLRLEVDEIAFDEASTAVALGLYDGRIGVWTLPELLAAGEQLAIPAAPPPTTCAQRGQPKHASHPAAPFTVERRIDLQGVWRWRSATDGDGKNIGFPMPRGRTHIVFAEHQTWGVPWQPADGQSSVEFHDLAPFPAITVYASYESGIYSSEGWLIERNGDTLRMALGGANPPPSFADAKRIDVFELETDPQILAKARVRPGGGG